MQQRMLIAGARIITATGVIARGWLLIERGRIAAFAPGHPPSAGDATILDARGKTLLPGFIDLHAHGCMGCDAMQGEVAALQGMARHFASSGVTAFLGTTWTDSGKRIDAALRAIAAAMSQPAPGAQLLGAHLEGPYLNAERCGAQHSDYIRLARAEEALPWLDLGVIRLLALAPEFARNQWLIGEAVNRGVTVSAAHSNASYKQMKNAVAAGLRQATHIFNAMSPLHHREPGAVGAALSLDAISCELICDLVHVHPAAIRVLHRCKGADKLILITDSVAIAGLPDGVYRHGHHDVEKKAGVIRIAADGTLAGSALTMNAALKNLMDVLDEPLEALWPTASLNPARAIGVDDRKGSIAPGKDADLALIDDCLNVQATIVAGNLVYRADE